MYSVSFLIIFNNIFVHMYPSLRKVKRRFTINSLLGENKVKTLMSVLDINDADHWNPKWEARGMNKPDAMCETWPGGVLCSNTLFLLKWELLINMMNFAAWKLINHELLQTGDLAHGTYFRLLSKMFITSFFFLLQLKI